MELLFGTIAFCIGGILAGFLHGATYRRKLKKLEEYGLKLLMIAVFIVGIILILMHYKQVLWAQL